MNTTSLEMARFLIGTECRTPSGNKARILGTNITIEDPSTNPPTLKAEALVTWQDDTMCWMDFADLEVAP